LARILVIDDNEDVRTLVADLLEAAGHEVATAPDGALGIDMQRLAPAALVVTDILMPEKEGLETIRDLKQEFPQLRIIAMSGAGKLIKSSTHLFTAKEIGADAILRKPFGSSVLLDLVQQVLRRP
jgi:DNA-binding response OmpR family regulator